MAITVSYSNPETQRQYGTKPQTTQQSGAGSTTSDYTLSGMKQKNETSIKPTGTQSTQQQTQSLANIGQVGGQTTQQRLNASGAQARQQSATQNQLRNNEAIAAGASQGFDANAYVANMTPAELNNLIVTGANLPTVEQRRAATAAADQLLSSMFPSNAPSTNGMGAQGGQGA